MKPAILYALLFFLFTSASAQTLPTKTEVLQTLKTTNQYWMSISPETDTDRYLSVRWSRATYFAGHMDFYHIYPSQSYLDYALLWGTNNNWTIGQNKESNIRHADNQCVGQAYFDLYKITGEQNNYMIEDVMASVQSMVESTKADDWNWVDALFMAMPVFSRAGTMKEDKAYHDKLYQLYTDTKVTRKLFDTQVGLWYRDKNYLPPYKTANGEKCFWSRGNGWAFGAHVRTLKYLPENDEHRQEYINTFKTMAEALVKVQRNDGFWGVSLADPNEYPGPETSGTCFFTYGLAWGINNGILDSATYAPCVFKAWNGLTTIALHENGRLGYVQGVGSNPGSSQPVSYNDTQDYAVGAFLLAGTEIINMLPGEMPTPSEFYADSVTTLDKNTIKVYFNKPAGASSAATIGNYHMNNGIAVTAAELSSDGLSCVLTVSELKQNIYTLSFYNIKSAEGEWLENPNISFTYAVYTITASGYQDGSTNYPENTIDNDLSTRWSEQGVSGAWIQFELDGVKMVESVNIAFYNGDQRNSFFEIYLSLDGTNYTKVLDGTSSGNTRDLEKFDFPDQKARFVKIVGKGNSSSDWNSYTEITIDYKNADTPTGLNTRYEQALHVYPNPCHTILNISAETHWELLSISGSALKEGFGNTIDLSTLKPGLYFIKTPAGNHKIYKQ